MYFCIEIAESDRPTSADITCRSFGLITYLRQIYFYFIFFIYFFIMIHILTVCSTIVWLLSQLILVIVLNFLILRGRELSLLYQIKLIVVIHCDILYYSICYSLKRWNFLNIDLFVKSQKSRKEPSKSYSNQHSSIFVFTIRFSI
jgi:membrane protein DedA with SNARE-associated domain